MKLAIFINLFTIFGLAFSAPILDAEIETRSLPPLYPYLAVNIFTSNKATAQGDITVFRYTEHNIHHETTTLLSFTFPADYSGQTCSFTFSHGKPPPHTTPNSQKVQLFTIASPISPSNTYTNRPYRGVSYGIFKVSDDGAVGTWDGLVPSFPCPVGGATMGFEVVPEGGFVDVAWPMGSGVCIVMV